MKLGISTKAFSMRYWDREIRDKEFKAIEVDMTSLKFPKTDASRERISDNLKKFDKSLHSSTGIFHKNKLASDMEFSKFKYDIWIAKELGIKQIVFHIARAMDPSLLKENLEELKQIIDENKEISFFVENNNFGDFSCEDELLWLCEKIPGLNICLDVGHLNMTFFKGGIKDRIDSIKIMKHKIKHVHLHDNNGIHDEHLIPGQGNLNWEEIIPLINEINPEKVILELLNEEDIEESVEFLRERGLNFD